MKAKKIINYSLLFIVVCSGILTAVKTDAEETTNFKECKVYPLYRCPDDDVRAHWSTSPDTEIKIMYENESETAPGHGGYVINAADVNTLPDPFTVTLKVNTSNGESRSFTVNTIHGLEQVSKTGLRIESTYRYRINLPPEIWSDDIIVHNISLTNPKTFTCTGSNDVHNFQWQVDKSMTVSGYMTKDNDYRVSFPSKPKAAGEWILTIVNPSQEEYCPGWKITSTSLAPTVFFTVSCD